MEVYQMEYFRVVAETEHFTKAAELLHISQPSLSKAISNLETELGVQLFERDKRCVHLSEYGKTFLLRVKRILNEIDEAKREVYDMAHEVGGDIHIGACTMFSEPSKVAMYTRKVFMQYPQIALHMYAMETAQIEESLIERKLDFGYAVSEPEHTEIEAIKLYTYRLGVVVAKGHPLAEKKKIWLSELKNEAFLCNNTSPDLRDSVYELCRKAGFEPRIAFEGESSQLIGDAVAAGRGVAFISHDRHLWKMEKGVEDNSDKVAFLEINDDFCVRTVYLFTLKDRYLHSAARIYLDGWKQE